MEHDSVSTEENITTALDETSSDTATDSDAGEELQDLMNRVAASVTELLANKENASPYREWLQERGIDMDRARELGLGFFPTNRYWLRDFLPARGYTIKFLRQTGLFDWPEGRAAFEGLAVAVRNAEDNVVAFAQVYDEEVLGEPLF